MTEQERNDLFNVVNGVDQKNRALLQANSRLTGDVSRFTNPNSMRAGSPILSILLVTSDLHQLDRI